MKTNFPKKENHIPQWFVLDATGQTLGRLSTEVSKLLRGKETSQYTPGINQGNYVVIINAEKIEVTGKKEKEKLYYRPSQRPGNLKVETFENLKNRLPSRIIEKAVWGMLPKGVLGRNYYRRLYVYSGDKMRTKMIKKNNQKWKGI
jgi:large subunit ribosomal protein L13